MRFQHWQYFDPNVWMYLDSFLRKMEEAKRIPEDFEIEKYGEYLRMYLDRGHIFSLLGWEKGEVAGYLHAEVPHPMWPKDLTIQLAVIAPGISMRSTMLAFQVLLQWARKVPGAQRIVMYSLSSPRYFKRRYNFQVETEEKRFVLEISNAPAIHRA